MDGDEFVERVLEADDKGDSDTVEALLCGAVKHLRANRAKPDQGLYLGLVYLAKTKSERLMFQTETIVEVKEREGGQFTVFCSIKRPLSDSRL